MNLHALRIFHEVAAAGSVTRAAGRLLVSQPAVTAQLRKLERELGLTLLAPHGRGVLLTDAGRVLAAEAARLFALEADVEARIADYKAGRSGRLRLAATVLPARRLLPSAAAAFRAACPGVEITLLTLNAREALRQLAAFEADLAIVGGIGGPQDGLLGTPLLDDELVFIVPAGHRLANRTADPAELLAERFVLREPGSAAGERLAALCRTAGLQLPRPALVVNGANEAVQAVAAGIGPAFVSALEAREAIERGEAAKVTLPGLSSRNPIVVYRREADPLPPAAAHFAAMLLEHCGK